MKNQISTGASVVEVDTARGGAAFGAFTTGRFSDQVRMVAMVTAFAALTALAAQAKVPLPGTPVPMTLQLAAVLLAGGLLTPGAAAGAMVLYLTAGAAGLPVFSPSSLGIMGPTGGYLLAFPLAAWLVAAVRMSAPESWIRLALGGCLGAGVVLVLGAAVLAGILGDWAAAIRAGIMPFLFKAGVEVGLAVLAAKGLRQVWNVERES